MESPDESVAAALQQVEIEKKSQTIYDLARHGNSHDVRFVPVKMKDTGGGFLL